MHNKTCIEEAVIHSLLTISNKTNYIPLIQSFIVENAKIYKLDKKLYPKLELVAEEAFLYVINSSFEDGESSTIKVKAELIDSYFELSFFDKGLPLDLSLYKEYSKKDFSTEGIELFLIKKYADNIEWINHGIKGKEFKLSFKILSKDIFSIIKNKTMKSSNDNIALDDIEIRSFKDSDAVKISRIIYRAYGYTYPNEDMYYPEKILQSNKNGELISIVSYDKKNDEIVGHYGLERPDLGSIAESGQAVVSPNCRGFGLMKKMRALLENSAKKLKLDGIYSQPVTSHTYSQQVNVSFGSSVCGFSFGIIPKKVSFKQMDSSLSQRVSCFLYFKPLNTRERELYLPAKHLEILKEIYNNLGLSLKEKRTIHKNSESIVKSNFVNSMGMGIINVEQASSGSFKEIKNAFYNLLFKLKADVIFLNISMEDEPIDELIEKIEKERFFFAGVHPSLLNNKDAIRFEFLNGVIDDTKIKIYSKDAKRLFEYILNEKSRVML